MHNLKSSVLVASGLSAVLLSGCSNSVEEQQQRQTYYCGAQAITVEAHRAQGDNPEQNEQMTLTLGDSEYQLQVATSASGARYVSEDTETNVIFWSRGNVAQLEVDGQAYPQCRQAGTLTELTTVRGNEPFWLLTISDEQMHWSRLGEDEAEYRIGNIEQTAQGITIQDTSERLQVSITDAICQDSMSGMYFPQQADVEFNGERLTGCAGDSLSLLEGVEWHVESLGSTDFTEYEVTLRFMRDDERTQVAGRAACNRYFGSYELTGESLRIGQLAGTKMACSDASMRVEYQFLNALSTVNGFHAERDTHQQLRIDLNTDQGQLRLRQP